MTLIDRDELLKHEVMIITKGNAAFHGVSSSLIETTPVIDIKNLQPVWRDPKTDPPKVETEVLVLCWRYDYLGITTAHYEDGNVFSEDSDGKISLIGEHMTRNGTTTESRKAGRNTATSTRTTITTTRSTAPWLAGCRFLRRREAYESANCL